MQTQTSPTTPPDDHIHDLHPSTALSTFSPLRLSHASTYGQPVRTLDNEIFSPRTTLGGAATSVVYCALESDDQGDWPWPIHQDYWLHSTQHQVTQQLIIGDEMFGRQQMTECENVGRQSIYLLLEGMVPQQPPRQQQPPVLYTDGPLACSSDQRPAVPVQVYHIDGQTEEDDTDEDVAAQQQVVVGTERSLQSANSVLLLINEEAEARSQLLIEEHEHVSTVTIQSVLGVLASDVRVRPSSDNWSQTEPNGVHDYCQTENVVLDVVGIEEYCQTESDEHLRVLLEDEIIQRAQLLTEERVALMLIFGQLLNNNDRWEYTHKESQLVHTMVDPPPPLPPPESCTTGTEPIQQQLTQTAVHTLLQHNQERVVTQEHKCIQSVDILTQSVQVETTLLLEPSITVQHSLGHQHTGSEIRAGVEGTSTQTEHQAATSPHECLADLQHLLQGYNRAAACISNPHAAAIQNTLVIAQAEHVDRTNIMYAERNDLSILVAKVVQSSGLGTDLYLDQLRMLNESVNQMFSDLMVKSLEWVQGWESTCRTDIEYWESVLREVAVQCWCKPLPVEIFDTNGQYIPVQIEKMLDKLIADMHSDSPPPPPHTIAGEVPLVEWMENEYRYSIISQEVTDRKRLYTIVAILGYLPHRSQHNAVSRCNGTQSTIPFPLNPDLDRFVEEVWGVVDGMETAMDSFVKNYHLRSDVEVQTITDFTPHPEFHLDMPDWFQEDEVFADVNNWEQRRRKNLEQHYTVGWDAIVYTAAHTRPTPLDTQILVAAAGELRDITDAWKATIPAEAAIHKLLASFATEEEAERQRRKEQVDDLARAIASDAKLQKQIRHLEDSEHLQRQQIIKCEEICVEAAVCTWRGLAPNEACEMGEAERPYKTAEELALQQQIHNWMTHQPSDIGFGLSLSPAAAGQDGWNICPFNAYTRDKQVQSEVAGDVVSFADHLLACLLLASREADHRLVVVNGETTERLALLLQLIPTDGSRHTTARASSTISPKIGIFSAYYGDVDIEDWGTQFDMDTYELHLFEQILRDKVTIEQQRDLLTMLGPYITISPSTVPDLPPTVVMQSAANRSVVSSGITDDFEQEEFVVLTEEERKLVRGVSYRNYGECSVSVSHVEMDEDGVVEYDFVEEMFSTVDIEDTLSFETEEQFLTDQQLQVDEETLQEDEALGIVWQQQLQSFLECTARVSHAAIVPKDKLKEALHQITSGLVKSVHREHQVTITEEKDIQTDAYSTGSADIHSADTTSSSTGTTAGGDNDTEFLTMQTVGCQTEEHLPLRELGEDELLERNDLMLQEAGQWDVLINSFWLHLVNCYRYTEDVAVTSWGLMAMEAQTSLARCATLSHNLVAENSLCEVAMYMRHQIELEECVARCALQQQPQHQPNSVGRKRTQEDLSRSNLSGDETVERNGVLLQEAAHWTALVAALLVDTWHIDSFVQRPAATSWGLTALQAQHGLFECGLLAHELCLSEVIYRRQAIVMEEVEARWDMVVAFYSKQHSSSSADHAATTMLAEQVGHMTAVSYMQDWIDGLIESTATLHGKVLLAGCPNQVTHLISEEGKGRLTIVAEAIHNNLNLVTLWERLRHASQLQESVRGIELERLLAQQEIRRLLIQQDESKCRIHLLETGEPEVQTTNGRQPQYATRSFSKDEIVTLVSSTEGSEDSEEFISSFRLRAHAHRGAWVSPVMSRAQRQAEIQLENAYLELEATTVALDLELLTTLDEITDYETTDRADIIEWESTVRNCLMQAWTLSFVKAPPVGWAAGMLFDDKSSVDIEIPSLSPSSYTTDAASPVSLPSTHSHLRWRKLAKDLHQGKDGHTALSTPFLLFEVESRGRQLVQLEDQLERSEMQAAKQIIMRELHYQNLLTKRKKRQQQHDKHQNTRDEYAARRTIQHEEGIARLNLKVVMLKHIHHTPLSHCTEEEESMRYKIVHNESQARDHLCVVLGLNLLTKCCTHTTTNQHSHPLTLKLSDFWLKTISWTNNGNSRDDHNDIQSYDLFSNLLQSWETLARRNLCLWQHAHTSAFTDNQKTAAVGSTLSGGGSNSDYWPSFGADEQRVTDASSFPLSPWTSVPTGGTAMSERVAALRVAPHDVRFISPDMALDNDHDDVLSLYPVTEAGGSDDEESSEYHNIMNRIRQLAHNMSSGSKEYTTIEKLDEGQEKLARECIEAAEQTTRSLLQTVFASFLPPSGDMPKFLITQATKEQWRHGNSVLPTSYIHSWLKDFERESRSAVDELERKVRETIEVEMNTVVIINKQMTRLKMNLLDSAVYLDLEDGIDDTLTAL